MKKLNDLFYNKGEAEIRCRAYIQKPENIKELKKIEYYNSRASEAIAEAEEAIKLLKEYQQALYERYQVICNTNYKLFLFLERCVKYYDHTKSYVVTIVKRFDGNNVADEEILREVFEGKERHKAFKRFEALKSEYPNIESGIDVDKKPWER